MAKMENLETVLSNETFDYETEEKFSPNIIKSINKIIQNEGYLSHTVYKRSISTEGGNYMSVLYEVDIKGKTNSGNKETNIFLKLILPNKSDKTLISSHGIFCKEMFFYTELAVILAKLQSEANIPDEEKYIFVKCYNESNSEALFLDNMTKKDYKTYHRMDIVPMKAMKLSVQQLAKFHALSIILERKDPHYFKREIKTKTHPLVNNEAAPDYIKFICKLDMDYLDEENKKKVENFMPVFLDKFFKYLQGDGNRFKCLCHGDYRMNNILVKEVDGEADSVIPVDYQIIYYGTPVADLIYFIFLSTDQQFRRKHMDKLKAVYFDSLKKFLKYYDIDLESVYPKKEFENDFKELLDLGLMTSLMILPLLYVIEDDVPDINNELEHFSLHESFKERIVGVLDDFTQWGYIV